jgi:signal transduction histidine kinase
MKKFGALLACFLMGLTGLAAAAEPQRGSPAEAEALVKRAIVYYQKNGREKAMDEFSKTPGPFVDRDLYVTVLNMQGDSLAHINPKQRGHNMLDWRDQDGKFAIRERIDIAKTKGKGWHEFKFFNPMTKKIEIKTNYLEVYDNLVFSAGAFRPE